MAIQCTTVVMSWLASVQLSRARAAAHTSKLGNAAFYSSKSIAISRVCELPNRLKLYKLIRIIFGCCLLILAIWYKNRTIRLEDNYKHLRPKHFFKIFWGQIVNMYIRKVTLFAVVMKLVKTLITETQ